MSMTKSPEAPSAPTSPPNRAWRSLLQVRIWLVILFLSLGASARGAGIEASANPLTEFLRDGDAFQAWIDGLKPQRNPKEPPPPQLPKRFRWTGRYVVSDLIDPRTGKRGITVPFVWWGDNGSTQMIAGGPKDPIYFTNFIYKNKLYTHTWIWPDLDFFPPISPVGDLTMDDLNKFFATSRFVGRVILQERDLRFVNHFRVTVVLSNGRSGNHNRWPLAQADLFVEQGAPTRFRQILHFGYQNLYDPELDEWMIIDKIERGSGTFVFPDGFKP